MKVDPQTHYDAAYFGTGQPKTYHMPDGTVREYTGPARVWHGFNFVVEGIKYVLPLSSTPSLFDIGCGAGDFVAYAVKHGFRARGVDISEDAITSAVPGARERVTQLDIIHPAASSHHEQMDGFEVVTALDLLEHIYLEDLSVALDFILAAGMRYWFFCICTARQPHEIWSLRRGEEADLAHEWIAVSGHVNIQPLQWWVEVLEAEGLEVMWRETHAFEVFRCLHAELKTVESWSAANVLICQRKRQIFSLTRTAVRTENVGKVIEKAQKPSTPPEAPAPSAPGSFWQHRATKIVDHLWIGEFAMGSNVDFLTANQIKHAICFCPKEELTAHGLDPEFPEMSGINHGRYAVEPYCAPLLNETSLHDLWAVIDNAIHRHESVLLYSLCGAQRAVGYAMLWLTHNGMQPETAMELVLNRRRPDIQALYGETAGASVLIPQSILNLILAPNPETGTIDRWQLPVPSTIAGGR